MLIRSIYIYVLDVSLDCTEMTGFVYLLISMFCSSPENLDINAYMHMHVFRL